MHKQACLGVAVWLAVGVGWGRADWPEFRGPTADGVAAGAAGFPLRWSETENVTWKTAIPHRGWSTPAIMDGQVWLTTARVDGQDFFALGLDARTGELRRQETVFHCDNPEPLGNNVNGYASPSPVCAPGRVYVHFGSYGTACLDARTGKKIWERTDLPCRHFRGPGSSPILFEQRLILTMDGVDRQYVVALDADTGRTLWQTDRTAAWNDLDAEGKPMREGDLRKAYSTPLVAMVNGQPQMFSVGAKAAYGYDPRTGRELWKVRHTCYSGAPRPLFAQGLALLNTGIMKPELWAVRVDGQGDVTDTHVAWKNAENIPKTPSPVIVSNQLYQVSDDGVASCLAVGTGAPVWRERLGGNYAASPICADGRLYFCSQQGKTTVVQPGPTCAILATNRLDDGCMASPAADGRALFLRTKTHLYRIEDARAAK